MGQKWLIFGARGFIGQDFCEYLKSRSLDTAGDMDAEGVRIEIVEVPKFPYHEREQTETYIKEQNPSHVLCLAGRTHGTLPNEGTIDYLEQHLDLNVRDNLYLPILLANICFKLGIHYTYFGTGCIYQFDEMHTQENKVGFNEKDPPNYTGSSYSTVKGYTDRLLSELIDDYAPILNLRIRLPVSSKQNDRSFLTKLLQYAKTGKICSIVNSISVLPSLYPAIFELIKEKKTGTYNCVNPTPLTHSEILELCKSFPEFKDLTWTDMEESKKTQMSSKRANNILDCTKLCEFFPIPDTRTALHAVLSYQVSDCGLSTAIARSELGSGL